jgi:hypothetical protein
MPTDPETPETVDAEWEYEEETGTEEAPTEFPDRGSLVTPSGVALVQRADGQWVRPSTGRAVCGAMKRQEPKHPCTRPAGWGTEHPGLGRCKLHGGRGQLAGQLSKGGRWSRLTVPRIRNLVDAHNADGDPLNPLPELALARSLLEDYVERYSQFQDALLQWAENPDGTSKPVRALDLSKAIEYLDTISKMVARVEAARNANAISRKDLLRILTEMARSVEARVPDPAVLSKIRSDWARIPLA